VASAKWQTAAACDAGPQEPRTSVPCVGLTSRIAEQFAGGRARWRRPPEGGKHLELWCDLVTSTIGRIFAPGEPSSTLYPTAGAPGCRIGLAEVHLCVCVIDCQRLFVRVIRFLCRSGSACDISEINRSSALRVLSRDYSEIRGSRAPAGAWWSPRTPPHPSPPPPQTRRRVRSPVKWNSFSSERLQSKK
jgi:hypothetical protein